MRDTKQSKTIGEHHVAAELARWGWAPALTRDGLERTDILAVQTTGEERVLVEVQVKAARGSVMESISWPLGEKSQGPSAHQHEFFVMVAIPDDNLQAPRCFVVPRIHVAAAAWIEHMDWLTNPAIPPGKRNAPVERSRVRLATFRAYENRWDLLKHEQNRSPILLPTSFCALANDSRVGLPPGHEWADNIPSW